MDVKEVRRRNVRLMLKRFDSQAQFAKQLGMDPAQLWQYLADPVHKSSRTMGDRVARRIEVATQIPYGCMDHPMPYNVISGDRR